MMHLLLLLLASAVAQDPTCVIHTNDPGKCENLAGDLVEWVKTNGGFINSKQEYRREDPDDSSSLFGVFTNERIEKGEILSIIPWDVIIMPPGTESASYKSFNCDTVRSLVKEIKLNDESKYAPFTRYLLSGDKGHIPSVWSEAGINLMGKVIGSELPSQYIMDQEWKHNWFEDCDGSDDPLDMKAAMLVVARAEDELLVPWYDMANHRNGHWLNTVSETVYGKKFEVRASRIIEAGEQIYNSYNMCAECGGRAETYHTPDILKDYGFVESMPQRWYFDDDDEYEFGFNLDHENGTDKLKVSWIDPPMPPSYEIEYFREQLQHLDLVIQEKNQRNGIPDNEWGVIWQYHEALTKAITSAIEDIERFSLEEEGIEL